MSSGQRVKPVAVVLAAAWLALAAPLALVADLRAAKFLRNGAFEICDYVTSRVPAYAGCWHDLMRLAAALDNPWANLALVALAPLLLAWLAILAVRGVRRLARGR
jgi:hypothetical protein